MRSSDYAGEYSIVSNITHKLMTKMFTYFSSIVISLIISKANWFMRSLPHICIHSSTSYNVRNVWLFGRSNIFGVSWYSMQIITKPIYEEKNSNSMPFMLHAKYCNNSKCDCRRPDCSATFFIYSYSEHMSYGKRKWIFYRERKKNIELNFHFRQKILN